MIVFEAIGKENTAATVDIALKKAKELDCAIVLSSNSGASAEAVLKKASEVGYTGKVVVVRNASNAAMMLPESRKALEARGCTVVAAANALSAGERSLSTRLKGIYPLEIMAYTLRIFGQGVKVCVECATMALDADAVPSNTPVVALGGTGVGLDTAVVLTPSVSASLLDTKIHEVLCKPGLY